jgi:hypothetical protein
VEECDDRAQVTVAIVPVEFMIGKVKIALEHRDRQSLGLALSMLACK